jgi:hypothetical protein
MAISELCYSADIDSTHRISMITHALKCVMSDHQRSTTQLEGCCGIWVVQLILTRERLDIVGVSGQVLVCNLGNYFFNHSIVT